MAKRESISNENYDAIWRTFGTMTQPNEKLKCISTDVIFVQEH